MTNENAQLPPEPTPAPRASAPAWRWPAVAGAVGLLVGAVLGSTITSAVTAAQQEAAERAEIEDVEATKSSLFEDAATKCFVSLVVEIADEGRTMIVDAEGEDFGSGDFPIAKLDCLLDALDAPASATQKMYETRSLDGRQSAEWGDISASWSYHPDDGLDIIFELSG